MLHFVGGDVKWFVRKVDEGSETGRNMIAPLSLGKAGNSRSPTGAPSFFIHSHHGQFFLHILKLPSTTFSTD